MGLWYLLTLYCALRGASARRSGGWHAASVACCALGMASKPIIVTCPLMTLLYDRTFLAGSFTQALRRRTGLYTGLALTWGLLAWMVAGASHGSEPTFGFEMKAVSPIEYALTQPGVILHYLRLTLWPHPLVLDYDWPIARAASTVLLPGTVLAVLLLATAWALRRRSALGFAGAWVFVILAPSSSLFPLADLAFEHRMYLPLAGVLIVAVLGVWRGLQVLAPRRARLRQGLAVGLLGIAVALLGASTARRNQDYRDERTMWTDTVAKRPHNAFARNSLGYALVQEGRDDAALQQFREAARLQPDDPGAYNNLGLTLARLGRFEDALAEYRRAIQAAPEHPQAYSNLGIAYAQMGRSDEAIASYTEALRREPAFVVARCNLANELAKGGRDAEAIAQYQQVLEVNPYYAVAHVGLAVTLTSQGRLAEAVPHYTEALRLNPASAEAHGNFGIALYHQGRLEEAARHLAAALRLDPSLPETSRTWRILLEQHPELRDR